MLDAVLLSLLRGPGMRLLLAPGPCSGTTVAAGTARAYRVEGSAVDMLGRIPNIVESKMEDLVWASGSRSLHARKGRRVLRFAEAIWRTIRRLRGRLHPTCLYRRTFRFANRSRSFSERQVGQRGLSRRRKSRDHARGTALQLFPCLDCRRTCPTKWPLPRFRRGIWNDNPPRCIAATRRHECNFLR